MVVVLVEAMNAITPNAVAGVVWVVDTLAFMNLKLYLIRWVGLTGV